MPRIFKLFIITIALSTTLSYTNAGYTHRLTSFATGLLGCYAGARSISPVLARYPMTSPFLLIASAAIIANNYPLCMTNSIIKDLAQEFAFGVCAGICIESTFTLFDQTKDDLKAAAEDLYDYARS